MIKKRNKTLNVYKKSCYSKLTEGERMETSKQGIKLKKRDGILIGCFLFIGIIFLAYTYLHTSEEKNILVKVDGKCVKTFSIKDTVTYKITSEKGTNILRIAEGKVWLEDADCPDRVCVNTGKIKYPGQSIICLPHKVVIEIKEDADAK